MDHSSRVTRCCLVSAVEWDINSYKPRAISYDHVDWGRQNRSCGNVVANGHVDCGLAFRIANSGAILNVSPEMMAVTSHSGQARRARRGQVAVGPESVPEGSPRRYGGDIARQGISL